ncbi:MAG: hypothetical protein L6Q76_05300, partial [Polyangiaceae bacterium]|nr:hypothetical protein [Polyangiaceae bacterium]
MTKVVKGCPRVGKSFPRENEALATLFRSFGGKCRSARESGFRVWGGVLLCGAGMVSAMPADHAKEPSYEINIGHFCGGFGLRSRAGRLFRHAA